MNPQEIQVHIEELVLDGFDLNVRWAVGDALEQKLKGLLSEASWPSRKMSTAILPDASCRVTLRSTSAEAIGTQVARQISRVLENEN